MELTKNFYLDEFECKSGAPMPPDVLENIEELAENLQVLRDATRSPITITSGHRSPSWNKKQGGASNSQHMYGTAADFKVRGMEPDEVARLIEHLIEEGKMKQGGLGIYSTWVHYDIRGTKARW